MYVSKETNLEDQWNRIEDPDMKPHNYYQLVIDKGAKNI
jgi:hypothetical protein